MPIIMPQTIFENLNFRFDTLRKSADLFQVKDRLTMAQTIRNEISNDSELDELKCCIPGRIVILVE